MSKLSKIWSRIDELEAMSSDGNGRDRSSNTGGRERDDNRPINNFRSNCGNMILRINECLTNGTKPGKKDWFYTTSKGVEVMPQQGGHPIATKPLLIRKGGLPAASIYIEAMSEKSLTSSVFRDALLCASRLNTDKIKPKYTMLELLQSADDRVPEMADDAVDDTTA